MCNLAQRKGGQASWAEPCETGSKDPCGASEEVCLLSRARSALVCVPTEMRNSSAEHL